MKVVLPSPYDYDDYRSFLADWFQAKKRANPRFSHRLFARLAGQRSPSLLLQVIQGHRNLTSKTVPSFCCALDLSTEECHHFADMVQYEQTDDPSERDAARARISARTRFRSAQPIDGDAWNYLSRWYLPAIRELAVCEHWNGDPAWVASHLHPTIPIDDAARALADLEELGLLVRGPDGLLTASDATIATPHEVKAEVASTYHRQLLELAEDAIIHIPAEARHLGAVTVAIPEDMVAGLKHEIAAFQERLLDMCDRADGAARQVYQLNIQLFPLAGAGEKEKRT